MNNIFITGASGFLGKHIINKLKEDKDFNIRCLIYDQTAHRLDGVEISYGDIRDYGALAKIFSENNIDTIIHLAAVIKSPRNDDFLEINVNGTKNLIDLAEKHGIKKFIFTSTDLVMYNVTHPYRETKLMCENIIQSSNLDFTIFRPTPIYGPGDTKNFVDLVSLVKKIPIIPVVQCGMDPVYVGDVVAAINSVINNPLASLKIYNLPGGSFHSLPEIFRIISKTLGLHRIIVPVPGSLFIPAFLLYKKISPRFPLDLFQINKWLQDRPLDISETKKDLGYDPLTLKEGISLTLR